MKQISSREIVLLLIVSFLSTIAIYFAYYLYDYGFFNTRHEVSSGIDRPTIEELINSAAVIFICSNIENEKHIQSKIDQIIWKNEGYVFHYKVGEVYNELTERKRPNANYGNGNLVFLSEGRFPIFTSAIHDGMIRIFSGGNFDNMMTINEVIQLVKTLKE